LGTYACSPPSIETIRPGVVSLNIRMSISGPVY
jgi:hypothetical protein